MNDLLVDFQYWCSIASDVCYEYTGIRNTCIQTSLALAKVLRVQGFEAEVFRAEAGVHCLEHGRECHGSVAGTAGDGTRRPKSDGWRGHLAVSCGVFVLDPTLHQLETTCGLRPVPAVFVKPDGWDMVPPDRPWQGGAWHTWREGDLEVRHARFHRQIGWKSKPAAKPSYWMDLVDMILDYDMMVAEEYEAEHTRLSP